MQTSDEQTDEDVTVLVVIYVNVKGRKNWIGNRDAKMANIQGKVQKPFYFNKTFFLET